MFSDDVTERSMDCLIEAIDDAHIELKRMCDPEDYENNKDMLESILNNIRLDFENYLKDKD